jgi:hypothetical protein
MPDEFSVRYWEDADLGRLPVDERDRQSVPIVVPGHHPVGIEKPVKRRYVESPQVAVCRIDDRRYVVEVTRNAVPVRTPGRGPDGTLPFDRTTNRLPLGIPQVEIPGVSRNCQSLRVGVSREIAHVALFRPVSTPRPVAIRPACY